MACSGFVPVILELDTTCTPLPFVGSPQFLFFALTSGPCHLSLVFTLMSLIVRSLASIDIMVTTPLKDGGPMA